MEFQTTFWSDFDIADRFGVSAIKDTFNRAFREWKDDYKYLTSLVIVLNWKLWDNYQVQDMVYYETYLELYNIAADYALNHLEGKELEYYLRMTD